MLVAQNRQSLRQVTSAWQGEGLTVALVPTMGNLHAGHIALVTAARKLADRVVTSIYVNPTQFGAGEDLDQYPRTPEADFEALTQSGCDLLFKPGVETMYPNGLDDCFMLRAPAGLASELEGDFRPGHFDGVVTVVCRLFNLVGPDVAIFGEKDFQQLQIIRRMVEDLGYHMNVHALKTVRDESGLALSSRNRFLDPQQLAAARNLSGVLQEVVTAINQGNGDFRLLESRALSRLEVFGLKVEYISIRREVDLQTPAAGDQNLRVLAAVWCGQTRLIDNFYVNTTCNHTH
jgi:pantoate--beta-alanine ligase